MRTVDVLIQAGELHRSETVQSEPVFRSQYFLHTGIDVLLGKPPLFYRPQYHINCACAVLRQFEQVIAGDDGADIGLTMLKMLYNTVHVHGIGDGKSLES